MLLPTLPDKRSETILERLGWRFIRIRGSEFYKDSDKTIERVMCVVQIGELVAQLSDEVKRQNPAIPWRVIKDTRNFYVHAYGSIDIPSVWDTLNNDIPALRTTCNDILSA